MTLARWIVLLVALERLGELALAHRNTERLIREGGRTVGDSHYPFMVLLHGGWLCALWFWSDRGGPPIVALLVLYGVLQLARLWVLASLGRYWTTRIVTLPGAPLVRKGPYRFLRHPNYLIVTAEIATLPLALRAWAIALIFSALNAGLILWRIRVEDRALAERRGADRLY